MTHKSTITNSIDIDINVYDMLIFLLASVSILIMSNPSIDIIYQILTLHWVLDFCLQPDSIAKNKSKSILSLSIHVAIYTAGLTYFGYMFAMVNGVLHFAIDYITSKLTSYFHKKRDTHNFFVAIGFDQLLHVIALYSTIILI